MKLVGKKEVVVTSSCYLTYQASFQPEVRVAQAPRRLAGCQPRRFHSFLDLLGRYTRLLTLAFTPSPLPYLTSNGTTEQELRLQNKARFQPASLHRVHTPKPKTQNPKPKHGPDRTDSDSGLRFLSSGRQADGSIAFAFSPFKRNGSCCPIWNRSWPHLCLCLCWARLMFVMLGIWQTQTQTQAKAQAQLGENRRG
ncbi:hypothetical protein BO70DRAFT_133569 [Aspergillus heteromorphus CBS 117.55]|uniref:Uncharacterized protein n=1 Tax=Aspergillus heteromorphus CBS 117.55 TaxID=1448321 RepID=A0A317WXL4_9EURO|nr:uncharacterized protein BO70DRAFT_133569 [Aspergillus heteromorphus CBS 117.55]PWY90062.1 hypothetical protein BO70DRAFT_133569 [Aspergillus heteromorphus CBS 117.55]